MSGENIADGNSHYMTGGTDARVWFERQWAMWPERADERYTTNLSFHYGAVQAFRAEHGREPTLSKQFRSNVEWLDRNAARSGGQDADV